MKKTAHKINKKVSFKNNSANKFNLLHLESVIGIIILFLIAFFTTRYIFAQQKKDFKHVSPKGKVVSSAPDRILVRFKAGVTSEKKSDILNKHSLTKKGEIKEANVEILSVPSGTTPTELTKKLLQDDSANIQFAETDDLVTPEVIPNDSYVNDQWYLSKIQVTDAWDRTKATGVILAVCDTGVDGSHKDLSSVLRTDLGYNTVDNTTNWLPVHYHGTMVAGAAAAAVNEGYGIAGIAWDSKIIPIRISNTSDGNAYVSDAAKCITYAADKGAKVINLSYLMAGYASIDSAAQYAEGKGAVTVVAAGNDAVDPGWPDYPSFLAVSATDQSDQLASFSNYGSYIDIAAPGVDILTDYPGGSFAYANGTSLAAPVVTGVLGLMFSAKPDLSVSEAKTILLKTSDDLGAVGEDNQFGAGRVNAKKAIEALLPGSTPSPTTTPTADVIPPSVPSELTATPNVTDNCCNIALTFKSSSDNVKVDHYRLYVNSTFSTDIPNGVNQPGTTITYQYTGNRFTTYTFNVAAVDSSGIVSDLSNSVTAKTFGQKLTVSKLDLSYNPKNGGVLSALVQTVTTNNGTTAPVALNSVTLTIKSPTGKLSTVSGITSLRAKVPGSITLSVPAKEKGLYTVEVTSVVPTSNNAYFYTYLPTITSNVLNVQ